MFGRRPHPHPGYHSAVSDSKRLTQRLRCINKALDVHPSPTGVITEAVQKRVCEALDNHILRCEGNGAKDLSPNGGAQLVMSFIIDRHR